MNPEEKAKDVSVNKYQRIHYWIRKNFGKADRCENDDCEGTSKKYEWALKKGKSYEKNINNFKMMCKSCHVKYDFTEKGRDKLIRINTGKKISQETRLKMSESHKKVDKTYMIGKRNRFKLSLNQVDDVIERLKLKHKISEIAKDYGVTKHAIYYIKKKNIEKL